MKRFIISMLLIVIIGAAFNISCVHADIMDPLNDVSEVTEPPSVIVREDEEDKESGTEEVDTKSEIKNKKELDKKHKAKNWLDTVMWACGIILVFAPLVCLTLMMFAWGAPAMFDRPFAFLTRHSIYETKKLKFTARCIISGTVGVLLLTGFIETVLYYTFGRFFAFIK